MQKSFRYRIYPNTSQKEFLAKSFGCRRFVYNYLLDQNIKLYQLWKTGLTTTKPKVNSFDLIRSIPIIKEEFPWLTEVSSVALQQSASDLGNAFKHFFSSRGFPRFKKKRGMQSIRLVNNYFHVKDNQFYIAKCKTPIRITLDRQLPSSPSSVTISKETDGCYYASFVCECVPKITNGQGVIGIDLGLKHFASYSDGSKTANPKFLEKSERKLKRLQRKLSKKVKGSNNRNKARLALARLHSTIKNQRNDFLHKLSRKLVNENQVIAVESLNIKGLLRNHKLAKAISSVSWSRFISLLKYKVQESQWCTLIQMDQWFPSTQLCSHCNYRNTGKDKLTLNQRIWVCPSCHTTHDRDSNAAQNILNESLLCIGTRLESFRGLVFKMELQST